MPDCARKLFVLDTNVLMHDPTSLFRFEEHDLYIPMMTLEELDAHKKGLTEVARNARQASRMLDAIVSGVEGGADMCAGIALHDASGGQATGTLFFQTDAITQPLPAALPTAKGDNHILAVLMHLAGAHAGVPVILVSKDINMRIKARALGLQAQDYFNDKTLEDSDLLYAGAEQLPGDFWQSHGRDMRSWKEDGQTHYQVRGERVAGWLPNEFLFLDDEAAPLTARVCGIENGAAHIRTITDYTHPRNQVWGITARNREQNCALNLLMDPEIDFVTLLGQAGTGKTLLTLAAGLAQVLDTRRYAEIIITRVTVSVGEDIGFLPGTEEEKMAPWMGALEDNLDVLHGAAGGNAGGDWGRAATRDLVGSKIRIKSLNFMRGRTFLNKFLIIDEAQNLTPKQMKTLITRAGAGTKVVCLGNLAQIDTPYLTEGSSGLSYVVDRFKDWPHAGHITLARGERSRLADYASGVL
ncbi:MAG: PhoH family protein [Rhodocyclaceae bacterium]|nr:PhoH family protein [Rhodocyclaceae bacterium]